MTLPATTTPLPTKYTDANGASAVSQSLSLKRRQRKGLSHVDLLQSFGQTIIAQAGASSPLPYGQRFSVVDDASILSRVGDLLFVCRPSAIIGRIRPVIILAIQRAIGWARAHVGQEVIEGLPALAKRNPSTAIAGVTFYGRIHASGLHSGPYSVSARAAHAMSQLCFLAGLQASATFQFASHQLVTTSLCVASAFASALPTDMRHKALCHESSEALIGQVV